MTRPLLLDLCCGAGGSAMGYHDAGFDIVGVDIAPQKNYPFMFVQADALEFLNLASLFPGQVAAIHASPPCQRDSAMTHCRPGLAATYPALIEPIRELLQKTSLPWVIENVQGAPLHDPVTLCGLMFDKELHRHRLFEASFPLIAPPHPAHTMRTSRAGHWVPGTVMSVAGHIAPIKRAREIMGIDWTTREELAEAVPPYMAEYVGKQLLQRVGKNDV